MNALWGDKLSDLWSTRDNGKWRMEDFTGHFAGLWE